MFECSPPSLLGGDGVAAGVLKRWAESSGTLDRLLESLDKQFGDMNWPVTHSAPDLEGRQGVQEALFVLGHDR